MKTGTVIIVGAGQAGGWVARTLRAEGFEGQIVLCGAETHPPYERPPLSKEHLQSGEESLQYLLDRAELGRLNIDWRAGATVERIDRGSKTVVLADDTVLAYDALVLCTGGRARMPAIPGIDLPLVHTLRTIEDAHRLRASLRSGARVLVVGGGWIGLEAAASARRLGCTVTVAEAGSRLCARTGSDALSGYLHRLHQENDVELRLNASLAGLEQSGHACRATYADGTTQEAEVVVVGIGLIQNDELARAAGLRCDRGIVVDAQCRTSDPAIFAAGDVTALQGEASMLRLESWQNAQDQGIAAARSVLGLDVDYKPVPFFWSQQYEAMIQIAGACAPDATIVTRNGADKLLHIELDSSGRAAGAICVNATRDFRQLRKFVEQGAVLDPVLLANPDIPLAKACKT